MLTPNIEQQQWFGESYQYLNAWIQQGQSAWWVVYANKIVGPYRNAQSAELAVDAQDWNQPKTA